MYSSSTGRGVIFYEHGSVQKFGKLITLTPPPPPPPLNKLEYILVVIMLAPHFVHVLMIIGYTFLNALELSKYWELNHKLTIKFLN